MKSCTSVARSRSKNRPPRRHLLASIFLSTSLRRLALAVLSALAAATAAPADVVTSADDVCAPTDDPCVISTSVEVDAVSFLDFGLRTVRIVPGGTLVGTVDLACGAFEVNLSPNDLWMNVATDAGTARATITARRACSGDSTTPCLTDTTCSGLGLGTCSVGDGGIRITGYVRGPTADIELRGTGDVAIDGDILVAGTRSGDADGGSVDIESTRGSVELASLVDVSASLGDDSYYGGFGIAGEVLLRAAANISVRERIYGTAGGATVELDAGGNVAVGSAILVQGLKGSSVIGGTVDLNAEGNLDVVDLPGGGSTLINISGGSYGTSSQYGYGTYAVPGGYGYFRADGDVSIGRKVNLRGNSGKHHGYADDYAAAGDWYLEAGGDLYVNAKIQGRGKGAYGVGRIVRLRADGDLEVGSDAFVSTKSIYAGYIDAYSRSQGRVVINGRLDTRASARFKYGEFYGFGGRIYIGGGDITIGGRVRSGGHGGGNEITIDACRLTLPRGAVINSGGGRQMSYYGYNNITVRESMVAAKGSRLLTKSGSSTEISYRDAAKPPVFDGKIKPAATLFLSPGLTGCPVCGNSEIDQGETCDDGNTMSGDGCDELCQLE